MFRYLPEAASEHAASIDWVNNLITDLSVFFTVAIVGSMLYFAIRYRRRDGVDHETPQIKGSHFLEVVWTVVPTIVCIFLGYYGLLTFRQIRTVSPEAYTINVKGFQWRWEFEYENGKRTTNEAVIPVDRPVKFVMTSDDVLHSFFIPAMRVKNDLMKGRYTYVTFKPIKTGDYHIFCTEYCGKDHSGMLGKIKVVSQADYDRWYGDRSEEIAKSRMAPAKLGELLYIKKGCNACHSLNGTRLVGPSYLKLFGKTESLADGTSVQVDENYIHESIIEPNKKIVAGFSPNQMPSFAGQLSDDEITALIAYIKSIDGSAPVAAATPAAVAVDFAKLSPAERGKLWYQQKTCNACHSLDGTKVVGPSFKGLYGKKEDLIDGSVVDVNDEYVTRSIKEPSAQVVKGFAPGLMPPLPVSDAEIKDLIEFIKTIK